MDYAPPPPDSGHLLEVMLRIEGKLDTLLRCLTEDGSDKPKTLNEWMLQGKDRRRPW